MEVTAVIFKEQGSSTLWDNRYHPHPIRTHLVPGGDTSISDHCHLMAVINYSSSFQNSLMAASAAAAYCFQVYYCHENHLFHPAKGAPQKRDNLHGKRGTLLVPLLRCPPSILMGNGGGTPPPPSLFTGAQSVIAYTMSPSLQRRMIRHFISAGKPGSKRVNCVLTWRKIMWWEAQLKDAD